MSESKKQLPDRERRLIESCHYPSAFRAVLREFSSVVSQAKHPATKRILSHLHFAEIDEDFRETATPTSLKNRVISHLEEEIRQDEKDQDARAALYHWRAPIPTCNESEAEKNAVEAAREIIEAAVVNFPRSNLKEIFERPPLEYLMAGMYLEVGTGVASGDYGSFKSFIVIAQALSVALGRDWHGRAVKKGNVVIIMPEGAYETAKRVKAFLQYHGIEEIPDNLEIIEMPVQIADPIQCANLIRELRDFNPALVIIDPLAKCNIGRDENDSATMGLLTHGMERIAQALRCFVLAIHHNNKNGTSRGSVALQANVDASIVIKKQPSRVVTIECDRVKGAPFEAFSLVGRVVELPDLDQYGQPVTSLIFESTDTPKSEPNTAEKMLGILATAPGGLTTPEWAEKAKSIGISKTSFYRLRTELEGQWEQLTNGRTIIK